MWSQVLTCGHETTDAYELDTEPLLQPITSTGHETDRVNDARRVGSVAQTKCPRRANIEILERGVNRGDISRPGVGGYSYSRERCATHHVPR